MKCLHCSKEFIPRQKYCSVNCRVYAHLKKEYTSKEVKTMVDKAVNDNVIVIPEKVTSTLVDKTVGNYFDKKGNIPFD